MGLTSGGREQAPSSVGRAEDPAATVLEALERCDGRVVLAAHQLGINRRWMYCLIRKYNLWHALLSIRMRRRARRAARRYGITQQGGI